MEKQQLILIDGSSYIYRAFHAIPYLSNKKGLQTNAIYGFTTMLMKVLKDFKPEHIAVVFDTKAPSFRHKLYEEYKAQRPEMPDSLKPQIPYIKEVVKAFNIPCLEMDGYEADDVIGTIAKRVKDRALKVIIVTGDKDMLQLVDKDTIVVDTMKNRTYTADEVVERFGVLPEKVTDIMGLAGDSSDNIPGVKGIGEKTASDLIKEFGGINELLADIDRVKNKKVRESLKAHSELALLSKKLATINKDVPIEINYDELAISPPDKPKLRELFLELEFNRLLHGLMYEDGALDNPVPACYKHTILLTLDGLKSLALSLENSTPVSVVVHSDTDSRFSPCGMAIALPSPVHACYKQEDEAFYIPFSHHYLGVPEQLDKNDILKSLRPFFEDETIKKITPDAKALHILLLKNNISLRGLDFDAGIASYLLNKSVDSWQMAKGKRHSIYAEMDVGSAAKYLCEEAISVNRIAKEFLPQLSECELLNLFKDIELPLSGVLASMKLSGIKVDRKYLEGFGRELDIMLTDIQNKIYTASGFEFNINSPKQLAECLFDKLKLKPVKKTKTGYSTNEEVLTILALNHELPAHVLNYRHLSKLKSTYVDSILSLINPETGRVHTSFNATGTATGRLSSSKPNLQNIPIRTELGRRIREAFISDEGCKFLSADYSQIELRIAAHLSNDEHLLNAFRNDEDIHARTAIEVFGVEPHAVTDEMRRRAKAINFGIIYGMGEYGLSKELGISVEKAQDYIDRYFLLYKGVREYIDTVIEDAQKTGYVSTICGRRRYIPELKSEVESVKKFGERAAVNTTVQGSAADLIKLAMIRTYNRFKAEGIKSKMLLQIHDELLFEVKEEETDAVKRIVKEEMENAFPLIVPIKVNMNTGKNWKEAG
ncbi:MAG: DNA polymerase I [Deltaproteobacteria bacterium GWC2_42_11]|nr:MAG: DNA polymerase I [Deltaproteobacteria bacterium GWC2_42_11]HBO83558.1 DNA polymerase I [Deltaproteobacteria bacterium]